MLWPGVVRGWGAAKQASVRKGAIVGGWPADKLVIQTRPAVYNG